MSEIKGNAVAPKIATRDSYGKALVELGRKHEDVIVLDADLAGATKTAMFQKEFPERHWDVGIAEANMTGIAADLQPVVKYRLSVPLRCLRRDVTLSRCVIQSGIRT